MISIHSQLLFYLFILYEFGKTDPTGAKTLMSRGKHQVAGSKTAVDF